MGASLSDNYRSFSLNLLIYYCVLLRFVRQAKRPVAPFGTGTAQLVANTGHELRRSGLVTAQEPCLVQSPEVAGKRIPVSLKKERCGSLSEALWRLAKTGSSPLNQPT